LQQEVLRLRWSDRPELPDLNIEEIPVQNCEKTAAVEPLRSAMAAEKSQLRSQIEAQEGTYRSSFSEFDGLRGQLFHPNLANLSSIDEESRHRIDAVSDHIP
jgi:hypothetical protein